jgi:hypothetical protein
MLHVQYLVECMQVTTVASGVSRGTRLRSKEHFQKQMKINERGHELIDTLLCTFFFQLRRIQML